MKNVIVLLAFALFTGILIKLDGVKYQEVIIEFQKLRPPAKEKVNVYYNGFKIGKSKQILPCPHSNGVCVNASLKKGFMFIPSNVSAKMKQKRIHERKFEDYIELIYPENPAFSSLENNAVIKGELAAGFHNYLNEEVSYNDMEKLKLSLTNTASNLEKSTGILVEILYSINEMTTNSKDSVDETTKNLGSVAKNLNQIVSKLNSSINPVVLKNILYNFGETSNNLNGATYYLKDFSGNLNDYSSSAGSTIDSVESIAKNTDEIVQGINCTLRKPFGGLRLLTGKVIKN